MTHLTRTSLYKQLSGSFQLTLVIRPYCSGQECTSCSADVVRPSNQPQKPQLGAWGSNACVRSWLAGRTSLRPRSTRRSRQWARPSPSPPPPASRLTWASTPPPTRYAAASFHAVFPPTQHILGNRPGMTLLICSNTKSKALLLRRRQPRLSQLETRSVSSDLCIPARRD